MVAYLQVPRLGQGLERGRREGEIAYYLERTPITAYVPTASPFIVLSGSEEEQTSDSSGEKRRLIPMSLHRLAA